MERDSSSSQIPVKTSFNIFSKTPTRILLILTFFCGILIGAYFFPNTKSNVKQTTLTDIPVSITPTAHPGIAIADWQTYENKVYKISFLYPPNWKVEPIKDHLIHLVIVGESQGDGTEFHDGAAFFVKIPQKIDLSLEDYVEANFKKSIETSMVPDYQVSVTVINGLAFKKVYFCGGGGPGCWSVYLTIKNGLLYEIDAFRAGAQEEYYGRVLDKMLSSLDISSLIKDIPYTSADFDLNTVKVGDQIGSMRIISRVSYGAIDKNNYSIDDASIAFIGQVVIKGAYTESRGDRCIVDLDESSTSKIPRMIGDDRDIWFCFNESNLVKQEFVKGDDEIVEIVIDNYVINAYPSEVYNTADLVRVVSRY